MVCSYYFCLFRTRPPSKGRALPAQMQWHALDKLGKLKKSERALRAECFAGDTPRSRVPLLLLSPAHARLPRRGCRVRAGRGAADGCTRGRAPDSPRPVAAVDALFVVHRLAVLGLQVYNVHLTR